MTASIGPRSVVATGPEEIKAAKWELEADTERFIQAAEVSKLRVALDTGTFADYSIRKSCILTHGPRIMFWSFRRPFLMVAWRTQVCSRSASGVLPYCPNPLKPRVAISVFTFATPTIISGVS